MSEFLVGLVGIMLLVVGLQQISILSSKTFEAHTNSRRMLAEEIAAESFEKYSGDFIFVETVDSGADKKIYTADDNVIIGDDSFYTEGKGFFHMVDYAILKDYLWEYERLDPYYRLSDSSFSILAESFSMHYGVDTQEADILPFLRKVLGRDTVNLKHEIFMPAWKGLMDDQ
jgi:hypothetical protein